MSGNQDKTLHSSSHDVDFSVIRTAIQIGGKSIEQILNGVHYGSAEVRHLLMNECDFILECKVCHNLFRSLPNFVAHKRVYCVEFYEEHKFNLLQKEKEGETIIVQPQPPAASQIIGETGSVMTQNKTKTNVISSVIDEVISGGFNGKSQAYQLYTQLAEKVEKQKDKRVVKQVTLSPIPSTSCAMSLEVKEVEVEVLSAFVEDKIETEQVGMNLSPQSQSSVLETKRSHLQRLCEKLAASKRSKIAGDENRTESNASNQNFEASAAKKKCYDSRTRNDTPENIESAESQSTNDDLLDSLVKRKASGVRTRRVNPIISINRSRCTEILSRNERSTVASRRKACEIRIRTESPDSHENVKVRTRTGTPGSHETMKTRTRTESPDIHETKKVRTWTESPDSHEHMKVRTRTESPDSHEHMMVRTRTESPDSLETMKVRTRTESSDSHVNMKVRTRTGTPDSRENMKVRTRTESPDSHENMKVRTRTGTPGSRENMKVRTRTESPDNHGNMKVRTRTGTLSSHENMKVRTRTESPDSHGNMKVRTRTGTLGSRENMKVRTRTASPDNHGNMKVRTKTECSDSHETMKVRTRTGTLDSRENKKVRTRTESPDSHGNMKVRTRTESPDIIENMKVRTRTGTSDSHENMKVRTRTESPDSHGNMNINQISMTTKRKVTLPRVKKDTFDSKADGDSTETRTSSDISPAIKKVLKMRTNTPDSEADVKYSTSPESLSQILSSDASKRKANEGSASLRNPNCDVSMTENESRNQSCGGSTRKKNMYVARIRKDYPDSCDVLKCRKNEEMSHPIRSLRKNEAHKVSPTATIALLHDPDPDKVVASSLPDSNEVRTNIPFLQGNLIQNEEQLISGSLAKEWNMNDQRQMHFWQKYCDLNLITCRLCDAKCADSVTLKLHVQEKHNIKFINLQCPLCYKAFFAKNLISRHLRRTHKKSAFQTSNLMRQVPGIGPDISEFNLDVSAVPEGLCPLCSKSFSTPHKLTRHMVRFHDKSRGAVRNLLDHAGVLYPTCSLCSKTLLSEYSLERHLEQTHGKTRDAAKKMMMIDKLKNKLLKEAETGTPSSSANIFIQNTDIQTKKQPATNKRSDKGRGDEHPDVLIRLCPGCKREFWKFKTFIRHWPFCARRHNLNRYKDLPQAKALRRGKKMATQRVKATMSLEKVTDPVDKGLTSGEHNEETALETMETERTVEGENRSVIKKVPLVYSRLDVSPYGTCSDTSQAQALAVPFVMEPIPHKLQSSSSSSSTCSNRNRDHTSNVSTSTEPVASDKQTKPLCSGGPKFVTRTEPENTGCSFKPFIAVTSGIGWRTCAGCQCVFAKARTYQKHARSCKLLKIKRSSRKTTINQKVKNDSCCKSSVVADGTTNSNPKGAQENEEPNHSFGLSTMDSISDSESNKHVLGRRVAVQTSTSDVHERSWTNLNETDGMNFIKENFEEISASEDEAGDWDTNMRSYNSVNAVRTVEEIWVGKQPGHPVEKIKSNRIYVVDRSRTRKSLCQDQKKINAYIDDTNLRCLQCGMEFSHISNVRRHVIRHLGWKRYKCRMCHFTSYNLSECRMHLYRSHSMEMWGSSSSQVEKFVVNLNKEASKVRTMKKQATLRGKRALEENESSPYSLKIPQNLPGQRSSQRNSQRHLIDRRKPGVNEQNIKNLNYFNISTRNVTRNFDTRPYAPVDRMSTLVTRKGFYPKASGGSSVSDSQETASKRDRNEDLEMSDHSGMTSIELDPANSQDLAAVEAAASSLTSLSTSIPVENL